MAKQKIAQLRLTMAIQSGLWQKFSLPLYSFWEHFTDLSSRGLDETTYPFQVLFISLTELCEITKYFTFHFGLKFPFQSRLTTADYFQFNLKILIEIELRIELLKHLEVKTGYKYIFLIYRFGIDHWHSLSRFKCTLKTGYQTMHLTINLRIWGSYIILTCINFSPPEVEKKCSGL